MNRAILVVILMLSLAIGVLAGAQPAPQALAAPADRDARFTENLRRWQAMTPEQRERVREIYKRWKDLPEEERQRIRENFDRFRRMKENQQHAIIRARQMMGKMHERTREDIRGRMREIQEMPPERRRLIMQKMMTLQSVLKEDWEKVRALPPDSDEAREMLMNMRVKGMILRALPPEEIDRLKNLPPEERQKEVLRLFEERRHRMGPAPEDGPHPRPPDHRGDDRRGDGPRRPFGSPRRPPQPPDAPAPDAPRPDVPAENP